MDYQFGDRTRSHRRGCHQPSSTGGDLILFKLAATGEIRWRALLIGLVTVDGYRDRK